ncbi:MAG: hypothetical protein KAJ51_06015, partial [Thermoplasmata archaeon]|nr:hypothetical protein [Thermoplasmata archaeon]
MQLKLLSIAILILLIFSALNLNIFATQEQKSQDDSGLIENTDSIIGTRGSEAKSTSRSLIESNSHGGSWLDSFKNDSGVDWQNSDQLNISDDKV